MCVVLHVKYHSSSSGFISLEFLLQIFEKNIQLSELMKILPVTAELFLADGRTGGKTDSRFSQFCECA